MTRSLSVAARWAGADPQRASRLRSSGRRPIACALLLLFGALAGPLAAAPSYGDAKLTSLRLEPSVAYIRGAGNSHTLLFTGIFADGSERDVTADVTVEIDQEGAIEQTAPGVFTALKEGFAKIRAELAGASTEGVLIVQPKRNIKVDFVGDVAPIFSKYGCNNTNCHGALNGQSGFKLSLFGYDPAADFEAVVRASDGRRINVHDPEKSLLVGKPTFAISHGGGHLIETGGLDFQTLVTWIQQGARQSAGREAPRLIRMEVFPRGFQTLEADGETQQIVVVGHYSDGGREDLTRKVRYTSEDDEVFAVTPEGKVSVKARGEGTILIRTLGHVAALRFGVAQQQKVAEQDGDPVNFIDEHIFDKLARMRVGISDICTDAEFVRRAYLDVTGLVPTAEEAREFIADSAPDKRARLVDKLLERPEYADFWAAKWGDLFANSVLTSSDGTAYQQDWLRRAFGENKPYDQFVTEVLTATGSSWQNGAVSYFSREQEDVVTLTAQAFLGLSLECARCHDHPSAGWKREDFLSMTAFFSQVAAKGLRPPPTENVKYLKYDQEFRHPETKQVVKPRFLDGTEPVVRPLQDRRRILADWMTSPENPWFAKATVNRFWNQFMGRGLVDPVDDFRVTNPATHEELLDELAQDFTEHGYDLHHLIRRIMNSKAYQLSSVPTDANREDETNYSRFYLRRLTAEQLVDSMVQLTGVPQDYLGYYPGVRAVNIADPGVPSSFLDMHDRPKRDAAKCERTESVSLRQAMHSLAGDTVNQKIKLSADKGTLSKFLAAGKSNEEIVEEFYYAALSRPPEADETQHCLTVIQKAKTREKGLQNVLWAVLSSNEFLYNH